MPRDTDSGQPEKADSAIDLLTQKPVKYPRTTGSGVYDLHALTDDVWYIMATSTNKTAAVDAGCRLIETPGTQWRLVEAHTGNILRVSHT